MPSSHERSNELAVLMDLRLAFGPGTHLWSLRSREEICYDWLHFKARQINASFRDFALGLYTAEKSAVPPALSSLHEIRRRVAIVLKAYRIKKCARASRVLPAPQSARIHSHRAQTSPYRPAPPVPTQALDRPGDAHGTQWLSRRQVKRDAPLSTGAHRGIPSVVARDMAVNGEGVRTASRVGLNAPSARRRVQACRRWSESLRVIQQPAPARARAAATPGPPPASRDSSSRSSRGSGDACAGASGVASRA